MPHGGRRPGAGAPKGNLNGLKHGRNSRRFQELANALAEPPEAATLFLPITAASNVRPTAPAAPLASSSPNSYPNLMKNSIKINDIFMPGKPAKQKFFYNSIKFQS